MEPEIVGKLEKMIKAGEIVDEKSVVYFMVGVRKLLELNNAFKDFPIFSFYCDWTLHSKIDRLSKKARVLELLMAIEENVKETKDDGVLLPLSDIIGGMPMMDELDDLLKRFNLPVITMDAEKFREFWSPFVLSLAKVLKDQPLVIDLEEMSLSELRITKIDEDDIVYAHVEVRDKETGQKKIRATNLWMPRQERFVDGSIT